MIGWFVTLNIGPPCIVPVPQNAVKQETATTPKPAGDLGRQSRKSRNGRAKLVRSDFKDFEPQFPFGDRDFGGVADFLAD
jgi:hypothetical protein